MSRSHCTHRLWVPCTAEIYLAVREAAGREGVSMSALMRLAMQDSKSLKPERLDRLAQQLKRQLDPELVIRKYNWSGVVLSALQAGPLTPDQIHAGCQIDADEVKKRLNQAILRLLETGRLTRQRRHGQTVLVLRR